MSVLLDTNILTRLALPTHLLTFNVADFTCYTGITVLDPNTIAIPPTP